MLDATSLRPVMGCRAAWSKPLASDANILGELNKK
jgi:hypothetical protein